MLICTPRCSLYVQIAPERQVALEYARQGEYKYLRCLGAFYLRLVCSPAQVYEYLEPLLTDYRKLRVRCKSGTFKLSHVDELIDSLLWNDYACNIALPRLPPRVVLERERYLQTRESPLAMNDSSDAQDLLLAPKEHDTASEEGEEPNNGMSEE